MVAWVKFLCDWFGWGFFLYRLPFCRLCICRFSATCWRNLQVSKEFTFVWWFKVLHIFLGEFTLPLVCSYVRFQVLFVSAKHSLMSLSIDCLWVSPWTLTFETSSEKSFLFFLISLIGCFFDSYITQDLRTGPAKNLWLILFTSACSTNFSCIFLWPCAFSFSHIISFVLFELCCIFKSVHIRSIVESTSCSDTFALALNLYHLIQLCFWLTTTL